MGLLSSQLYDGLLIISSYLMSHLMIKIADLIKTIRNEKGISQEKLAHISNLDRTYISGIECHRRNISINTLEQIIEALEISNEEFFKRLTCTL